MAWPFSTPVSPSFDTGLMAVPDSITVLTPSTVYVLGITVNNPTATSLTFTVTDTAGSTLIPAMEVPPGLLIPFSFAFEPIVGLKWEASGVGLVGHIWGY